MMLLWHSNKDNTRQPFFVLKLIFINLDQMQIHSILLILKVLVLFFLFSCISEKKCQNKYPPQIQIKDSISTITDTIYLKRIDTVFMRVLPDTIYNTKVVYKDVNTGLIYSDTSILENDFSISKAWVDRILNHELIQKDSTIVLTFEAYDKLIKTLQSRYRTETKVYKEKYIPKFIKFLAWSGGVFWFFIIIVLAIRFIPQLSGVRQFLKL